MDFTNAERNRVAKHVEKYENDCFMEENLELAKLEKQPVVKKPPYQPLHRALEIYMKNKNISDLRKAPDIVDEENQDLQRSKASVPSMINTKSRSIRRETVSVSPVRQ